MTTATEKSFATLKRVDERPADEGRASSIKNKLSKFSAVVEHFLDAKADAKSVAFSMSAAKRGKIPTKDEAKQAAKDIENLTKALVGSTVWDGLTAKYKGADVLVSDSRKKAACASRKASRQELKQLLTSIGAALGYSEQSSWHAHRLVRKAARIRFEVSSAIQAPAQA